jgi:predicted metal-dependent phosphoesterase TrpH
MMMQTFMRNKLVSITRKKNDILFIHGVLDDDIYGLEMNMEIRITDLTILSLDGKWNHWTTPECPRAVHFLQEAVGLRIDEEGFSRNVHKLVGRKACRHFANLTLECCHSAREAALLLEWEDQKAMNPDLTFETFMGEGRPPTTTVLSDTNTSSVPGPSPPSVQARDNFQEKKVPVSEGMVLDLHVHTSPASPCSSASVDDLIREARRIGLDGICLTDHNYRWSRESVEDLRQKHGFLILRGNEITTDQGDMLVFGLDRHIKGIIQLKELADEVHHAEGFIIAAHPFRGFLTFGVGQLGLTPQKAAERPLFRWVNGVEVLNGKVTREENSFASEVAATLGLPVTGGSDAHEVSEVGLYATRFLTPIRNENELVNALKAGGCSPCAFRAEKRESVLP